MSHWITVCKIDECVESEAHSFTISNEPILIIKKDEKYYAIEDSCSHQGLPLADGWLDAEGITCPFHGAKFCFKTGKALCAPAMGDLKRYETQILHDELQILFD